MPKATSKSPKAEKAKPTKAVRPKKATVKEAKKDVPKEPKKAPAKQPKKAPAKEPKKAPAKEPKKAPAKKPKKAPAKVEKELTLEELVQPPQDVETTTPTLESKAPPAEPDLGNAAEAMEQDPAEPGTSDVGPAEPGTSDVGPTEPGTSDKVPNLDQPDDVAERSDASEEAPELPAEQTPGVAPIVPDKTEKAGPGKAKGRQPAKRAATSDASAKPAKKAAGKGGRKIAKATIEHCSSWSVFKRKAAEAIAIIAASDYVVKGDFISEINNGIKPRRGAFEITLTLDDGEEVLLWSGLKRGPPRKDKFPDVKELLEKWAKTQIE